jgi:Tat protein translocase TatB subunit
VFGPIGGPEMVVILVIALLVFGPRKLPELARSIGKGLAELRRTSTDLKDSLEREIRVEEHEKKLPSPPAQAGNGQAVPTTLQAPGDADETPGRDVAPTAPGSGNRRD